jgi:hypothetical protein
MTAPIKLHPRHRSDAAHSRETWPHKVPDGLPSPREFALRRQVAFESKRRDASLDAHAIAKRIALDALRAGASAAHALAAARRYLDKAAPRARRPR